MNPLHNQSDPDAWAYCEKMLPLVSRTFALNIQRLTGTLYQAVLIGYLLFRMADTLEDTTTLSEAEKVAGLRAFAGFFDRTFHPEALDAMVRLIREKVDVSKPEGELLARGDQVLGCYLTLPEDYREIIGKALKESALGMARFQERKRLEDGGIYQLRDWNELTLYCYYVAGVVGKMLTDLFCLDERVRPRRSTLTHDQIHFGLALQMTNIAKDYPEDLDRGWCYLPRPLTTAVGVTPEDLLKNPTLKRPEITKIMIKKTLPHLRGAYRYIREIPTGARPIRLFCLIPFVLAYHTLENLYRSQNPKLSRKQVRELLARSETFCTSNERLEEDFRAVLSRIPLDGGRVF